MNLAKPIVMLDRDGTINFDPGYLTDPTKVQLLPGAADAVARLKNAGFLVVIVSNQSAIGRGMATVAEVEATNSEVLRQLLLANSSAVVDLLVYCEDHPDSASDRRKPAAGMIRDIAQRFDFDSTCAWVVGDKESDLQFGKNAGLSEDRCILVATGCGTESWAKLCKTSQPKFPFCTDLSAAVAHILKS